MSMIRKYSPAMLAVKRMAMHGDPCVEGWRLESRRGEAGPELFKWDSGKAAFYSIRYRGVWHNCPTFADVKEVLEELGYTGALPDGQDCRSQGSACHRVTAEKHNHYRTAEGEINRR